MKRLAIVTIAAFIVLGSIPTTFISCTDIMGDGVDSIYYPGTTLPQNTSYRNPVWEPDFELGTIYKGATNYIAIGSETQWAKGITYCGPTLTSTNLMDWSFNQNVAFPLKPDTVVAGTETTIFKRPDWAEGRIHSMTAAFARTVPGTSYWMFYQIGDTPAIGAAFARSPQGPFSDMGKMMDTADSGSQTITHPYFIVVGTRFYLFYSTESGTYCQELSIRRGTMPTLRNAAVKVSNESFTDVAVYRKGDYFYLFGRVMNGNSSQINYARAEAITGPYVDKSGTNLTEGNGIPLIESNDKLINPENVCGIFADFYEDDFILYNVTDSEKPTQDSGYNRRPLVMDRLNITEEGWVEGTIKPTYGWTSPKFKDKE